MRCSAISGIRRLALVAAGVASCTVVLVTAISPGDGHVAVWMGVSTRDAHAWLQAGIERTGKQRPAEYIEVGKHGRQISLLTWPTRLGHRARIRLAHRGSLWRITIDGHSSRWTLAALTATSPPSPCSRPTATPAARRTA